MNPTAARTLRRYYLFAFVNGLQFTWTTWLAYVLAHGGNPGWAEGAFHLAILLSEVPTGVVADLYGRKRSIMVGLLLSLVAALGHLLISDTLTACLILALSGLSSTFLSGAEQAWLYEITNKAGGAELAQKAIARSSAIRLVALALAPMIAGFLYEWQDWAPFIAKGAVLLVALGVMAGLPESQAAPAHEPSPWRQARQAFQTVRGRPVVLALLLFGAVYNTLFSLMGQFGQAYFPATGLTMGLTGIIFAAGGLLSAAGSHAAERFSPGRGLQVLRFLPMLFALAMTAMGIWGGFAGATFYLVARAADGLMYPVLSLQLQERIPDEQRATILSLDSAGFSLLMAISFPAASYLEPVSRIYLVTGVIGVVLAFGWLRTRFIESKQA